MKWPWNRRKSNVSVQVPPEVEEYYQSGQKDRWLRRWLTSFASLVITILAAIALFFAGRWIYQTVIDSDDNSSETTQTENEADQPTIAPDSIESEVVTPSDDNAQQNDGALDSSDSDTSNQDTLPSGPATNDTDSQTPTAGPSDPEIPRTGPTE